MKKRNNLKLGALGENAAANFIVSLGYRIINRNFQKRYGEIDIVALDAKTLVFVEVRTRKGDKFGLPEETITPWKLRTLIKSANYYKLLHPNSPDMMRIDLVAISLSSADEVVRIKLYKNITG